MLKKNSLLQRDGLIMNGFDIYGTVVSTRVPEGKKN